MSNTAPVVEAAPKTHQEITALVERAQKGDKAALPLLRQVLKDPDTVDMLGGDLAAQVQFCLIGKFNYPVLKESLPLKLERMRADLGGPAPPPVQRSRGRPNRKVLEGLLTRRRNAVAYQCSPLGPRGNHLTASHAGPLNPFHANPLSSTTSRTHQLASVKSHSTG